MNGLFGSPILDVAIGLIFTYLLLAIICTSLNEWIASMLRLRSRNLSEGIKQLLDHQPGRANAASPAGQNATTNAGWLLSEFYKHPLVAGMCNGKKHPSYIPARTFATTLIDIVSGPDAQLNFASFQESVKALPDGDMKRVLTSLLRRAGGNLTQAQTAIETWYDDCMDRVSGWYKRKIQIITAVLAILLAVAVNADTMKIASTLWHNPEIRAEAVKLAEQRAEAAKEHPLATQPNTTEAEITYPDKTDPLKPTATIKPVTPEERQYLNQVIGWDAGGRNGFFKHPFLTIIGWLLTGIAVALGAPFWFDLLNKFINVRGAGKAPNELPKTPSKTPIPEPGELPQATTLLQPNVTPGEK